MLFGLVSSIVEITPTPESGEVFTTFGLNIGHLKFPKALKDLK